MIGRRNAGADFSSASSDFRALGAFFCPLETLQLCRSRGSSVVVAHRQPGARVLDIVGSSLPRPYHFPARIQSYQVVAAPFPGDSVFPSGSLAAIPATQAPRLEIDDRLGDLCQDGRGNKYRTITPLWQEICRAAWEEFFQIRTIQSVFFDCYFNMLPNLNFRDVSFKPGRRA